MPSRLTKGQLVEVTGLTGSVDAPEEFRKEIAKYDGPKEVNGHRGQLVEWREETSTWIVALFGAFFAPVPEAQLRPLTPADIKDFDVALGPVSSGKVVGEELTDKLSRKGHCLCKAFVSPEDLEGMVSVADRAHHESAFTRLPPELEPGYLGIGGQGKTLAMDLDLADTASYIKDSQLRIGEDFIQQVGLLLTPHVSEELGFDIYSRSHTMLWMPFTGDEDSIQSANDVENEDAATFLTMMWRAKLQVIFNAGPSNVRVDLHAKPEGEDDSSMLVKPGMLGVFMVERYNFSLHAEGKTLCLSSWYLNPPRQFVVDSITGDYKMFTGAASGPPIPKGDKGEHTPVVSIATRYAFGVDEAWKLWVAYGKAGFDTMIRHPFQRWDCDLYYEPDADQTSGKSYTCHGGFSDGIELFDCKFFEISPAEAKTMDPTQRQVLEVSYIALQGAGFSRKQLQSKPAQVAVFVGLDKNEWNAIPKDVSGGFGASSNANAITSNRFNYCMNLKGASMTIDTACSASLVCTHTAKLYLQQKNYDPCEAAIVCGVNLSISPLTYIGGCQAGMHSHIGRCMTYNATADGYARGEATAACGLKSKTFDTEAGDLSILAGSQVNQDGRSASMTAPNGPSQERCNKAVMQEIGLKPPEIDTTECHGTGTSLGDPIEIGAYRKVMGTATREQPVTITSSKSNIGHCEGSAGISGFLKCVLLNIYAEGTPNVHLNRLNPHLDMDGFPGIIMTEGTPFRAEASFNGVLSFGFGGTNACAMCWGKNIMTSRQSSNKDIYELVIQKIANAPAPDVTITGDDWEDWDMEGPERFSKPGDAWDLEFEEDGVVNYYPKHKELADVGGTYYLTGTFNDWECELAMEPDQQVKGLYTASITIGSGGEEAFQIVADRQPTMTFFPQIPSCMARSVPVEGPKEDPSRENTWVIRDAVGDVYRVEFYRSEVDTFSINWVKEK